MYFYSTFIALSLVIASTFAAPVSTDLSARQVAGCSDVVVFFARGTTEPGTLGTVIGPGFSRQLGRKLTAAGKGSLNFQGIAYPANVAGFLAGGDAAGAATMARSVTNTAASCPNAKIVMSGYSQGAQVVHKAAAQLPANIQARVSAVVTFGDPNENRALPGGLENRRKTFCNAGDLICDGRSTILLPHLTYGQDAGAAADFVVSSV